MTAGLRRVSVVIPCRNEAQRITGLLDAICDQSEPASEVVVVDSSSDGTAEVVDSYARAHPDLAVRLVPASEPSIPAAVNTGVRAAAGDVIVRLDGHSAPNREYIARALAALGDNDKIGVVGGVWKMVPGADTLNGRAIAIAGSHPAGAGDAAYRIARGESALQDVDTVPFGCYRKTLWAELGGLNESLLTNEDYEFNYRVRASGRRVVLDPVMQSTYFARSTLLALASQYYRYGWWKVEMLRRHPSSLKWRQAVPACFVAAFAALSVAAPLSYLASLLWSGLVLIYCAALAIAASDACRKAGAWIVWPNLIAAFAIIHFCWGGGAIVNLLGGGRRRAKAALGRSG